MKPLFYFISDIEKKKKRNTPIRDAFYSEKDLQDKAGARYSGQIAE